MPTANRVASYIIRWFQERQDPITNLKLQKLLYYVQGWHLGLKDRPAFDGRFVAWVHGPVNLDVYHEYKPYRWSAIDSEEPAVVDLDPDLVAHIEAVLDVYGGDSAVSLEQRTHTEDPWLEARGDLPPDADCRKSISEETMTSFFKSQAKDAEDNEG